jgi:hypothetical protein
MTRAIRAWQVVAAEVTAVAATVAGPAPEPARVAAAMAVQAPGPEGVTAELAAAPAVVAPAAQGAAAGNSDAE